MQKAKISGVVMGRFSKYGISLNDKSLDELILEAVGLKDSADVVPPSIPIKVHIEIEPIAMGLTIEPLENPSKASIQEVA